MNIFKIYIEDYKCLNKFSMEIDLNNKRGISPLILVGLNGSGKSSLLEAISEYLNECYLIENGKNSYGYFKAEIEYDLSTDEIIEIKNGKVFARSSGEYSRTYQLGKIVEESDSVLPNYLVAYSSGLNNESFKSKFKDVDDYYYRYLIETARSNLKDESQLKIFSGIRKLKRQSFYVDFDINQYLFLALFLFDKHKTKKVFDKVNEIKIDSIESFILEWKPPKNFDLPSEMQDFINILEKHNSKKNTGKYDYKIDLTNDNFKNDLIEIIDVDDAFKFFTLIDKFKSVISRYDSEFKITALNVYSDSKIFEYKSLSDGEHQLIHILSILLMFKDTNSLILLDEPDTHLNPKLRANFISLVDYIMNGIDAEELKEINPKITNEEIKMTIEDYTRPQIIISTHSPFIVGDTPKENIRHFVKDSNGKVTAKPIDWQSFGATFDNITAELFELPAGMSDFAEAELREIINSGDKKQLKQALKDFGDSMLLEEVFEKLDK